MDSRPGWARTRPLLNSNAQLTSSHAACAVWPWKCKGATPPRQSQICNTPRVCRVCVAPVPYARVRRACPLITQGMHVLCSDVG